MARRFFITGTDTDIGKTHIAALMLNLFNDQNLKTVGLKPVECGCDDALILQQNSSIKIDLESNVVFSFSESISPHLAAEANNIKLTVPAIIKKMQPALAQPADIFVIEGAGGWNVPLNSTQTMADLALALDAEIVLVVGMRLGCLNHAILTSNAIIAAGGRLTGWVANCIDPKMHKLEENIATLEQWIRAPLLEVVDYSGSLQNNMRITRGKSLDFAVFKLH